MIECVAPGIYSILIPLPGNPLKSLNSYLIKKAGPGSRNLLIDTGFRMDACRHAMDEALESLHIHMDETDIFLTHVHSDHTGLAPDLAGPDTKVFLSGYDRTRLPGKLCELDWDKSDAFFLSHGFPQAELREVAAKNPARAWMPAAYDDYIEIRDGDLFRYGGYALEAVETPGHTPGHMCLFDRESGVMFCGDHVLFDITPNITCWQNFPNALGAYLESLKKVAAYPVRLPLPGHRAVHCSFSERITQLQVHHAKRCREVLQILHSLPQGEALSAYTITSRMTWRIRCNSWADFPSAQKWFAVGEAIAHLEYLESLQQVSRLRDGDSVLFQAV